MNEKACSKRATGSAKSIWITEYDKERLRKLIKEIKELETTGGLQKLEAQLDEARVVRSREVPENVVTMNCLVKLSDPVTQEQTECWLRFSRESEEFAHVVPILSDLGIALLGSREGDIVEWSDPHGRKRSTIVEIVYQPERLGNYEL